MDDRDRLPPWVTWQQRPFPDANLLLLPGRNPALVDSGFVGHADQTADWVHAHTGQLSLVVNTDWHASRVHTTYRPRLAADDRAPNAARESILRTPRRRAQHARSCRDDDRALAQTEPADLHLVGHAGGAVPGARDNGS